MASMLAQYGIYNELKDQHSTTDFKLVFDAVAATRLYYTMGIGLHERMTNTHFEVSPLDHSVNILSNYQIDLDALDPATGRVSITANDRGCDIAQDFEVADEQAVYFKTTSEIGCSSAAYYSRLVFTAGTYSPKSSPLPSNLSLISCVPGLPHHPGFPNHQSRLDLDSSHPIVRSKWKARYHSPRAVAGLRTRHLRICYFELLNKMVDD
ncbi:MAG: hypothetical protein M1834_002374 [Cirrosporium novae-zelandiae]|nr:MAG: hypothetical protein M1834_002374 [Cirrosporium novae-zelandiae]